MRFPLFVYVTWPALPLTIRYGGRHILQKSHRQLLMLLILFIGGDLLTYFNSRDCDTGADLHRVQGGPCHHHPSFLKKMLITL